MASRTGVVQDRAPRGKKALSDIPSSGNPNLNEESKKNFHADPIPEEELYGGFLHNHEECIKCFESLSRPRDSDLFLEVTGLGDSDLFLGVTGLGRDNGISKKQESPISPESRPRNIEIDEIDENPFDWKERDCSLKLKPKPPTP